MKKYSAFVLTALVTLMMLANCKSPSKSNTSDIDSPNGNSSTMDDIRVPSNFDWKTFADYDLTIDAEESGLVQVVSKKGAVYHRAYLSGTDAYAFRLSVPTYETEVKVRFKGQEVLLDLSSKTLFYSFEKNGTQNNKDGRVIAGM